MRLGVFLDYAADPDVVVERVVAAEGAGVDIAFAAEAYGFDVVSLLGYIAARTERIGLASGILPLGSRSPALLAMTAAGLDRLSRGRFTLGLGTSGPQVMEGLHGVRFDRPLVRTRETIEVCRMAWRRESVVYDGSTVQLPAPGGRPMKLLSHPLRDRIPIIVAAMGPKNVALTAELAEGWLPMLGMFHPEAAASVFADSLAAGAARRPDEMAPLDIAAGADLAIAGDAAAKRKAGREMVALYVGGMGSRTQNFYNDLFRRYGHEDEAAAIQDHFLAGRRAEALAAVPESFVDATTLCGDEAFVRNQIRRYRDAGVTTLLVRTVGDDPIGDLAIVRSILDDLAKET
jgi:F420-dependent oxidoreductase-like protein